MHMVLFPIQLLIGCEPTAFYVVFIVSVLFNLFLVRYNMFITRRYFVVRRFYDEIWPRIHDLERRILKKG